MQKLIIPFRNSTRDETIAAIADWLSEQPRQTLEHTPWSAYPYKPSVTFAIAHDGHRIFLKYFVEEKNIRAVTTEENGPVWEDSCVEFFVSLPGNTGYYNFEFNCIGAGLLGFGAGKADRSQVPAEFLQQVKRQSLIRQKENAVYWELTLIIPKEAFQWQVPHSLEGLECRANFYKCGDALPDPHFVSWSNIDAPQPNFHLPGFFGTLVFARGANA